MSRDIKLMKIPPLVLLEFPADNYKYISGAFDVTYSFWQQPLPKELVPGITGYNSWQKRQIEQFYARTEEELELFPFTGRIYTYETHLPVRFNLHLYRPQTADGYSFKLVSAVFRGPVDNFAYVDELDHVLLEYTYICEGGRSVWKAEHKTHLVARFEIYYKQAESKSEKS